MAIQALQIKQSCYSLGPRVRNPSDLKPFILDAGWVNFQRSDGWMDGHPGNLDFVDGWMSAIHPSIRDGLISNSAWAKTLDLL